MKQLVRFVLNKETMYLSPKYRIFAYYNIVGRFRFASGSGLINTKTGSWSIMSEITYPPFGYVMTIDAPPPDERLFEITYFARYAYDEFVVMPLKLPVLPTHLLFPGDYRDKDQIRKDEEENIKSELQRRNLTGRVIE